MYGGKLYHNVNKFFIKLNLLIVKSYIYIYIYINMYGCMVNDKWVKLVIEKFIIIINDLLDLTLKIVNVEVAVYYIFYLSP